METRIFSLTASKSGDLQPKHLLSYEMNLFFFFFQGFQRELEKTKILVMSSHFLTLSFSTVTVGILGAEQKDHTNSESEVTFS